jgi:hypothetical protein
MLYEVDHATFAFKNKRGDYPWIYGREEVSSDTFTLILYHMVNGNKRMLIERTSIAMGS